MPSSPDYIYGKALRLAKEDLEENHKEVYALLLESSELGSEKACYALATWFLHGTYVRKNYKRAFALLNQSAAKGNAEAAYDLAICYETGLGAPKKNPKEAFRWYLYAADRGDLDAIVEVARCSYYGIGTRKDLLVSIGYSKRAAKRGVVAAQYALGRAYELGEGVSRNIRWAKHWYQKAAKGGDKDAMKAFRELSR